MSKQITIGLIAAGVIAAMSPANAQVLGGTVNGAANGTLSGDVAARGKLPVPPVKDTVEAQREHADAVTERANRKARKNAEKAAAEAKRKAHDTSASASGTASATSKSAAKAAKAQAGKKVSPGVEADKTVSSDGSVDAAGVSAAGESATDGSVKANPDGANVNGNTTASGQTSADVPR